MPYCPTCGTQNTAQAAFCTNCGANLAGLAPTQNLSAATSHTGQSAGHNLHSEAATEGALSPSVMGAFAHCIFKNYSNFSGRASRTEYWGFFLTFVLLGIIGAFGFGVATAIHETLGLGVLGLFVVGYFAVLIPMLAVTVRRLHDTGKSGWWYLISFVPYVGSIVLFIFVVLPSDEQVNQWGGPPQHS